MKNVKPQGTKEGNENMNNEQNKQIVLKDQLVRFYPGILDEDNEECYDEDILDVAIAAPDAEKGFALCYADRYIAIEVSKIAVKLRDRDNNIWELDFEGEEVPMEIIYK